MDRPELPCRGAWLFLGTEGIHLMEVPNPDPVNGRPAHGGFDRHACLNCRNVEGVGLTLEKAGLLQSYYHYQNMEWYKICRRYNNCRTQTTMFLHCSVYHLLGLYYLGPTFPDLGTKHFYSFAQPVVLFAGIPYQRSVVPSIFTRDPDGNGLEFIEVDS